MSSRMDLRNRHWLRLLVIAAAVASRGYAQSGFNVLTRNYDNQRTGANTSETVLNASNVNSSQFGKLFMLPLDDQVYAGVLYVSDLQIAGGTHNVIYVATNNNTVYAFDADTFGPPLWARNFNGTGRPLTNGDVGQNCSPYTRLPGQHRNCWDAGHRRLQRNHVFRDPHLGKREYGPKTSRDQHPQRQRSSQQSASDPGQRSGNRRRGSTVVFNPATQNQRPALALSQGVVYIAWASYCDTAPYHGWVLAYNEASLAQVGVFNDTPNGSLAGIWMAGAGPVSIQMETSTTVPGMGPLTASAASASR